MKKWIYTLVLSLALSLPALAQRNEKIESLKVAFITQKLDLSAEESQKFWPIYNNYHREFRQLALKRNQQRKAFKQQAADGVDDLETETEMLELRKRYRVEFSKVLPKQKANMVYAAEREFNQQLIEDLRNRRERN
jgi:hypothetical protein